MYSPTSCTCLHASPCAVVTCAKSSNPFGDKSGAKKGGAGGGKKPSGQSKSQQGKALAKKAAPTITRPLQVTLLVRGEGERARLGEGWRKGGMAGTSRLLTKTRTGAPITPDLWAAVQTYGRAWSCHRVGVDTSSI